jgi:protein TonB
LVPFSDGMTRPTYDANELVHDLYTREARDAQVQGLMMVKCSVLADGTVKNCRMIKSLQFLSDAVLDRLSHMKMKPATFEGQPVAIDYVFTFNFKLPPSGPEKKK